MADRPVYVIQALEGDPVEVFARVYDLGGRNLLTRDDVATAEVYVWDVTKEEEVLRWPLIPSELITAALVTDDAAFRKSGGYNLNWVLPAGITEGGRKRYSLEFFMRLFDADGHAPREQKLLFEINTVRRRAG